jgi:hypothetical protein
MSDIFEVVNIVHEPLVDVYNSVKDYDEPLFEINTYGL